MLFLGQPEKRNLGSRQRPGVAQLRVTETGETLETLEEGPFLMGPMGSEGAWILTWPRWAQGRGFRKRPLWATAGEGSEGRDQGQGGPRGGATQPLGNEEACLPTQPR